LSVSGGVKNQEEPYNFNQVATVTANATNGVHPFSHWEDAEGNVLSTKSVYKFTMYKNTSITAVFAVSPEYVTPIVNMSETINLREGKVSYIGQFDLPTGYELIEYGFIFSRSSMVLTLESAGITVAQSNVHNGNTKEFLMSFDEDLFNSARAYLIVKNSSEVMQYFYSENMFGVNTLTEQIVYQTGFESAGGFTADTVYNNVELKTTGSTGMEWSFYFGTPSTTGPITAAQSAQLRYYTATPNNHGYAVMTFDVYNVTKVEFKALNTSSNNLRVQYSVDGGNTFTGDQVYSLGTASADFTYNVNQIGPVRLKFTLVPGSTNGSRVTIDDVKIYSGPLHEIEYVDGATSTFGMVKNNASVTSAPTKAGYSFAGWYLDQSLLTPYQNEAITQSQKIYAKFTANQYTITFNSNGGSSVTAITQDYNTEVYAPSNPTREGYTFNGWFTSEDHDVVYVFSTMPAANTTVYAKWTINEYTISFNSNEGSSITSITQNFGTAVIAPMNPSREGYSFVRWYISDPEVAYVFGTMPAANITLNALWNEIIGTSYDVIFDSNGGTSISSIIVSEGDLATIPNPAPTKTGYTFVGWETENNDTWDFENDAVNEDLTLYAVWQVITYSITYSNLESTTHSNPNTYTVATSTITLTDPSARSGFTFAGWFDQLSEGVQVTQIVIGSTGNKTVYARWTATTIYTATIDKATTTAFTTGIADGPLTVGTADNNISIVNSGSATLSVSYFKNSSSTTSIFNNSAGEIRLYGGSGNGGQLTINVSSGYKITSIVVYTSTNSGYSINGGNMITSSGVQTTFSSITTSVILKNIASSTNQVRITEIVITYVPV
jgi:uncharacterized repeat protein (TIGR02543 family)